MAFRIRRAWVVNTMIVLLVGAGTAAWTGVLRNRAIRPIAAGDMLDPSIAPRGAWTVVALVTSECSFCTASMPFYRTLTTGHRSYRFVFAGPQAEAELRAYAAAHQVGADAYRTVANDDVRVAGTPTLLLVDPAGAVARVWLGQVDPARERWIQKLVSGKSRMGG